MQHITLDQTFLTTSETHITCIIQNVTQGEFELHHKTRGPMVL